MTDWAGMFYGVRKIAQSADTFEAGLRRTIEFAPSICKNYDHEYWRQVELSIQKLPVMIITNWAREGLRKYSTSRSWSSVLLDLGDCPEIFYLSELGFWSLFLESHFRNLILSENIFHFTELAEYSAIRGTDPANEFLKWRPQDLVHHNVRELNDPILSWNLRSSDYCGDNGYLLWLAIGTIALIEPLRNKKFCQQILKGQKQLYLLPGYGEIFFYLATVTPEGLLFENNQ